MSAVGIGLAAGSISVGAEFVESENLNFKKIMAWLGISLVFGGLDKIAPPLGSGLATITMITVLLSPVKGANNKSPADVLNDLVNGNSTIQKGSNPTVVASTGGTIGTGQGRIIVQQ